jgi:hypothetical protein
MAKMLDFRRHAIRGQVLSAIDRFWPEADVIIAPIT